MVLTFHPHPSIVVGRRKDVSLLTTPDERAVSLGSLGIDFVITYPFEQQTAATSAMEFILLLKQHLNFSWLGVGQDFALGRSRQGNVNYLNSLSEVHAYDLKVFNPVELDGFVVSSSRIREALTRGDVVAAARMLGRPYFVTGEVVVGDGRGRTLGIPTANLSVDDKKLIPASGVYACQAKLGIGSFAAAVNIGRRPTFHDDQALPWVEAHLLDFTGDLYGQTVQLEFVEYIREEQRFVGVEALIQQIKCDIQQTRDILRA